VLTFLMFVCGPMAAGELVHARRTADATSKELNRSRERERALVAATVLARERTRLAREMHDVVSHKVSLIAVEAGAMHVLAPTVALSERAESVRTLGVATLDELRHMVRALRTPPASLETTFFRSDLCAAAPLEDDRLREDEDAVIVSPARRIADAATLILPSLVLVPQFLLVLSPRPLWQLLAPVVLYAALLFRRRWPLPVLVITSLGLLLPFWTAAPVFFALYAVAASRRRRNWHVVPILVVAALYICLVVVRGGLSTEPGHTPLQYFAASALGFVLVIVAPLAVGEMVHARRLATANLAHLARLREREKTLLAATVLAQERARLAREMHDVVSHNIALIAVEAGAMTVMAPAGPLRERAESIRALSSATLDELRQMVKTLRGSGDDLPSTAPQPRLADIPDLATPGGPNVSVDLAPDVRNGQWPEAVQRSAYRTVQEALTNARKHAPEAGVRVVITRSGDGLDVLVENDPTERPGQLSASGGGHGLVGLKERADLLDGSFEAGATDEGGFRVHARFPLPTAPASPAPVPPPSQRLTGGGAGLSPA
jgi:signal transduction histidine kinase